MVPMPTGNFIMFPPRERGWSPFPQPLTRSSIVSPARAGMVPGPNTWMSADDCFPRASGDGPLPPIPLSTRPEFPPRERGWSPRSWPQRRRCWVSPARAGMVLLSIRALGTPQSFPRASGDGPQGAHQGAHQGAFPPRERGWSHVDARGPGKRGVSPARAGMVLRERPRRRRAGGFPRASGDGPSTGLVRSKWPWFPPRERGWSRIWPLRLVDPPVSPARAGMVPWHTTSATKSRRFPRASGDGPRRALFL